MNKSQYWTTEIFQIEWNPMAMVTAEEQKSRLLAQKTKKMSHTIYITSQQKILLTTIRIQETF